MQNMMYIMVEQIIYNTGVTSSMKRNGLSHEEAGKLGAIKSTIIAREQKKAREEEYYKDPKKCPVCGTVIPYDKRHEATFCSRSCAATHNNKEYPKRSSSTAGSTTNDKAVRTQFNGRICPVCGKTHFKRYNVYCSIDCANRKTYSKHVTYIKETGSALAGKNGEADRRVIRRYLLEEYGHKCSICGITEWQGKPAPLVVDHIDGDSTNNKIDNFRLVCGNCDMQLPTYKSKNKNGRSWRKQYYTHTGYDTTNKIPEVHLKCQWCGKEFTRRAANVPAGDMYKDRFFSCSRSCGAHLSSAIQSGKYTPEQLEQMHKDNIVSR